MIGSDKELAKIIEKWLKYAGRPAKVLTGKRMFDHS
jgi:hypothetical protein